MLAGESGAEDPGWSRGVGVAGLDQDGCLDLVVANFGSPVHAFGNRCAWGNHWVGLKLIGTRSNRDAVGAVVRVRAGGVTWRRDVMRGSTSVHSSRSRTLQVGIGAVVALDEVVVDWPSGLHERFDKVPVDHYSRLTEGTGTGIERSSVVTIHSSLESPPVSAAARAAPSPAP